MTLRRRSLFVLTGHAEETMSNREDGAPIVRCPGCNQPMEEKERKPAPLGERLVDVHYVCNSCGMETTKTISE
jgi:uncharacterized protein with PIN domain